MSLMWDALKQIEIDAPPVILSLPRHSGEDCNEREDKNEQQSIQHSRFSDQRSSAPRFAFPELPEPHESLPAPESPRITWPECCNVETRHACEDVANGILHQLSLDRPRVFAFTSPGDGDGKSSVLLDLAPQLAKRIAGGLLVVDANFRNPSLSVRLTIPAGDTAARSVLIYPTNVPRLNVLPASSIQFPERFDRSWIEELREGWLLTLLDMASLEHAEVMPLASCCDGVYLVVRVGHTARRAVAEAARVIRRAGSRLLGCVVVG
jgi:Mrp family chromosome partitioning ATPase